MRSMSSASQYQLILLFIVAVGRGTCWHIGVCPVVHLTRLNSYTSTRARQGLVGPSILRRRSSTTVNVGKEDEISIASFWCAMAARGEAATGEQLPDCWDAHNHLQLSNRDPDIHKLLASQEIVISLMGTQPADWTRIQALATQNPGRIRPSYGLHPWWAHEHPPPGTTGWMAELRTALENDPSACLGEIGLDGQWVPPGLKQVQYEQQLQAFRSQLQLAVELRRPVSLHCVKAYGDMFDILRGASELPPAVYMHSWGGKVGMLQSYLKMKKFGTRFYFGFSCFANLRANCHKTKAVIAAVPDDRLLLESDLENPDEVAGALQDMLRVVAEAKGCSVEQAAAMTKHNAQTLHDLAPAAAPAPVQPPRHMAGEVEKEALGWIGGRDWQELNKAIKDQADKVRAMKEANKVDEGTFSKDELAVEIDHLKSMKRRLSA